MAFDVLRVPYAVPMRLFRDSDDTIMIRWYPCLPGAKKFPYPHSFGSLYWDTDRDATGYPLGEVTLNRAERPFRPRPFARAAAGQEFHGDPDWFLHGIPPGATPRPMCGAPPPAPDFCILQETGDPILLETLAGCIEVEHS